MPRSQCATHLSIEGASPRSGEETDRPTVHGPAAGLCKSAFHRFHPAVILSIRPSMYWENQLYISAFFFLRRLLSSNAGHPLMLLAGRSRRLRLHLCYVQRPCYVQFQMTLYVMMVTLWPKLDSNVKQSGSDGSNLLDGSF
jgi:hypothetical protein